MKALSFARSCLVALAATAAVSASTTASAQGLWRCDAWPALGAQSFYWVSYDLYYAQAQALGACQATYGYSCYYRCYPL